MQYAGEGIKLVVEVFRTQYLEVQADAGSRCTLDLASSFRVVRYTVIEEAGTVLYLAPSLSRHFLVQQQMRLMSCSISHKFSVSSSQRGEYIWQYASVFLDYFAFQWGRTLV